MLSNPSQLLGLLSSIGGQVTTVGNVDLDGTPTTEYRDHGHRLRARHHGPDFGPARSLGAKVAKILQQLGNTSVPINAWVGTDGYVRQISASLDLSRATLGSLAGT